MKYLTILSICIFITSCASNEPASNDTESAQSASSSSTAETSSSTKTDSSVTSASHSGAIIIQSQIPYSKDNAVPAKIRNECTLNSSLSGYMTAAADNIQAAENVSKNTKGKVLIMEITGARSWGNAFIGHSKAATVKGTLYDNGKRLASFTARRISGGGMWGGFKSSCSVLNRIMKVVAKDIVNWLNSPVDGARLGDA